MQIKEFSEPAPDTAAKDQAPSASATPAAAPSAITLDLPAAAVIPHALAKLEKPTDEIYTVGGLIMGMQLIKSNCIFSVFRYMFLRDSHTWT